MATKQTKTRAATWSPEAAQKAAQELTFIKVGGPEGKGGTLTLSGAERRWFQQKENAAGQMTTPFIDYIYVSHPNFRYRG